MLELARDPPRQAREFSRPTVSTPMHLLSASDENSSLGAIRPVADHESREARDLIGDAVRVAICETKESLHE
jgi:hypothetical protein